MGTIGCIFWVGHSYIKQFLIYSSHAEFNNGTGNSFVIFLNNVCGFLSFVSSRVSFLNCQKLKFNHNNTKKAVNQCCESLYGHKHKGPFMSSLVCWCLVSQVGGCVDEAGIGLGHIREANTPDWSRTRHCSLSGLDKSFNLFQTSHCHEDVKAPLKLFKLLV